MDTTIRRAAIRDTDALIELSHRTIRTSYGAFLGDEAVYSYLASGAVATYVRECIDRCAVVDHGGKVAGFAVWRDNLIDLMMIDHRFHRRGLGTRLLLWVEEMLGRTHGELRLESFAANQPANDFYRHHAWLEVHRYVDPDSGTNKIVFQKVSEATPG